MTEGGLLVHMTQMYTRVSGWFAAVTDVQVETEEDSLSQAASNQLEDKLK